MRCSDGPNAPHLGPTRYRPSCPLLTLVVTSRVLLSIDGERIVTVEPLDAPTADDAQALLANPQVRILIDRVHDSGGELHVDDRLAPHLALLLSQCGGLPLALELVAAQLSAMPVGDLLDHLSDVLVDGEDRLRAVGARRERGGRVCGRSDRPLQSRWFGRATGGRDADGSDGLLAGRGVR